MRVFLFFLYFSHPSIHPDKLFSLCVFVYVSKKHKKNCSGNMPLCYYDLCTIIQKVMMMNLHEIFTKRGTLEVQFRGFCVGK